MAVHHKTTSRNLPWSCDSFVVLADASATGTVMLGKIATGQFSTARPSYEMLTANIRQVKNYGWLMWAFRKLKKPMAQ